jgi:hypothetical protein
MAKPSEHAHKADQNRKMLATIDPILFPDWVITVSFYLGLHTISMILPDSCLNAKHNSHRAINSYLSDPKNTPPEVWRAYKNLFDASHLSRYSPDDDFQKDCPSLDEVAGWVKTIENFVHKRLGL